MRLKQLKNKIEAKHVYNVIMVILYIYLIGKCIYQYFWGNGLEDCKLEFLLMVAFSLVVYVVSLFQLNSFNQIKSKGKVKKKKAISRFKKDYIWHSGFVSLLVTTFIYLLIAFEIINVDFSKMISNQEILSIIGLAILLFIVFFVISYFIMSRFLRINFAKVK